MIEIKNTEHTRSNKFNKENADLRNKEQKFSWDDRKTRRLFRSYQRTGDLAIRDKIFLEYLPLVELLAKQHKDKGIDYDDLYQEGCLGLLRAIERFDPSRACQFSSFAPYFIKGQIRYYFRSKTWPCYVPRDYKQMSLRIRELTDALGREPTKEEIVEAGCAPADKVEAAIAATKLWQPVCIHVESQNEKISPTLIHSICCMDEDIETAADRMTIQSLAQRVLTPEEASVIHLYYFEDYSQHEIAKILGTYQMLVLRLLRKGTDKLKAAISKEEAWQD